MGKKKDKKTKLAYGVGDMGLAVGMLALNVVSDD